MALTKTDEKILQEIVDKSGNCLEGKERCRSCPFRSMCLPEFLNEEPLTKNQRLQMALRVLVHNAIIDPDSTPLEELDVS